MQGDRNAELKTKKDAGRGARKRAAVKSDRKQLKEDPERYQNLNEQTNSRSQKNRQKLKSTEEKDRQRLLHDQQQTYYVAKKKADMQHRENHLPVTLDKTRRKLTGRENMFVWLYGNSKYSNKERHVSEQ